MKVAITGVAGLIGSNLAEQLVQEGVDVVGIDDLSGGPRSNVPTGVDLRELDISAGTFEEHLEGVDVVYHLAAYSSVPLCQENPMRAAAVNVTGTVAVIESMRRLGGGRLIAAETSAVYEGTMIRPTPEEEDAPRTVYGITKRCGARLLHALAEDYGVRLTVLRFFNVYGNRHDYNRVRGPVIPSFIRAALLNEPATIYGDGTVSRDFIHVDDVNLFHRSIIDDHRSFGRVFNLGTGEVATVSDIHALVASQTGVSIAPRYFDVDIPEAEQTLADTTRARSLDWSPRIGLADGIGRCVQDARRALRLGAS